MIRGRHVIMAAAMKYRRSRILRKESEAVPFFGSKHFLDETTMGDRRPGTKRKRPKMKFFSMLLFSKDEEGNKMKTMHSMRSMVRYGSYYGDKLADWLGDVLNKRKKVPDEDLLRAQRLAGLKFPEPEEGVEKPNKARENAMGRSVTIDKRSFSRYGGGVQRGDPNFKVYINPEMQDHHVGSEYVPANRQIRRNEDPWPLDKPEKDEKSPPRHIKGPDKPPALESPGASQRRRADVALKIRSGEAAANRGAAKARDIAKKKASSRSASSKKKGRSGPERG